MREPKTKPLEGEVSEYRGFYKRLKRGGGGEKKKDKVIRLESYNMPSGHSGVLESALLRMDQIT